MIFSTVLVTLLFSSPASCLEYMNIMATSKPAAATQSYLTPSLAIIMVSGAKVVLHCNGNEYRAVLLAY